MVRHIYTVSMHFICIDITFDVSAEDEDFDFDAVPTVYVILGL